MLDALELVDPCERGEVLEDFDEEDKDLEEEDEDLEEEEEEAFLSSTLQVCMMQRKAATTAGLAGSSGFKLDTSFNKRSIRSSGV